jgi:hypothetical protein
MSDRLTLANAIEDAGIERAKAERVASVVVDLVKGTAATKGDLDAARTELKTDIAALRTELKTDIAALRRELKTDISAFRTELKTDIAAFRTGLKTDIAAVRTELKDLELRLTLRLGGLILPRPRCCSRPCGIGRRSAINSC